jgi:hypothetical protein
VDGEEAGLRLLWPIVVDGREVEIDLFAAFALAMLQGVDDPLDPSSKGVAALDQLGLLRRDDASGKFVLSERGMAVRQGNERLLMDALLEMVKGFMIVVPKEEFEAKVADVLAKKGMTLDMLRTQASRH